MRTSKRRTVVCVKRNGRLRNWLFFTGEVVRLIDKEGHSLQGFFNRVEFVLVDGTIKFRVVINPILECENCIMASCHEDYLYEVVSVEKFTYKNYRYHL